MKGVNVKGEDRTKGDRRERVRKQGKERELTGKDYRSNRRVGDIRHKRARSK